VRAWQNDDELRFLELLEPDKRKLLEKGPGKMVPHEFA